MAWAESPETVTRLDPLVVTATSRAQRAEEAPASLSVVAGETLRQRPVRDLADAVQDVPGVDVTDAGLGRKGISIRGMQSDHTLVLVDGMRINNSASAIAHSDYELGWVPAEAIERVEVVRGPLSSLYGSEALGGVVNVITRKATDRWQGSVSAAGVMTDHGRGGDQRHLSGYAGGPLIPGVLGLSVWGEFQDQSELRSADDGRVSSLDDRDARSGNATLTWTPDERQRVDVGFGTSFEDRWHDTQNTGSVAGYYRSEDDVRRQRISVTHAGEWTWGDSRVRLYRSVLDRINRRDDDTAASGPHKFIDTVGDGQLSFAPDEIHQVTLGGEVRRERLEDPTVNARGRAEQTHYAAFAQDEIILGERWALTLGSRLDQHEEFGTELSPRAYLLYHATDALTFKGGVGSGFKAPTLKQLSPDYAARAGGGRFTIVGNPDLEPEKSVSFEAGFEYRRGIWSARTMAFQNEVDDLIQSVCRLDCERPVGATWSYENVDKARIRGVELGGGVELMRGVNVDANYTYSAVILALIGASITFFVLTVRRRWLLEELRAYERSRERNDALS